MEKTTKKTAIDSQIKVNLPEKTKTSVFVERNISSEAIGKDMASRITGKMIDVEELYDPKTKCLITQKKLQAKGAVFLTVDFQKVLTFETKTARLLISVPIALRPVAQASTRVVPPPINGSRTRSFGFVKVLIAVRAKRGEKRAG